ncbi:hypothetical protein POV27_10450 [Aureisphaera galaxeae]|uniref:hypothetical protein n=1 Tax=Aureisphaera galaxeae TaxID=1538023 RepID=UPI002350A69D|nr:hypothetical protein [Aureisphaera galaxeae]MDC8004472.1 hypothetical protein [Aureisphaera galaxeae]
MKWKTLVYAMSLALLFVGCQSDDDGITTQNPNIEGDWNLVEVSGGLLGTEDTFDTGLILWNFADRKLEVTNRNTDPEAIDLYETGMYNFGFDMTSIPLTLTIGDATYTIDTFTDNELTLDDRVADGYFIRLIR